MASVMLAGCGGAASQATTSNDTAESKVESVVESVAESVEDMSEKENIGEAMNAEAENAENVEAEVDPYEGQYTVEEMTIDDDGTKIYGRMYLPLEEKDKYPTVIMSHGIGGTYTNCEPYARKMAANGVAAFAFDFQGGGPASQSDGKMVDMSTLTEAQDLEVVTDALKEIEYVDAENLFLLGESMGGFVSAYVAAQRPDDYKGIILYYPAFVLQDDAWQKFPDGPETAPEVEVIYGIEVGRKSYIDNMSFDIYEVIGKYTKDVLIVHGDKDPVVPISYSERALTVYESAELKTIPDAEHGFRGDDVETAGQYALDFVNEHIA